MTAAVYYLAYGSNLHPQRLSARLGSVKLKARVEIPDRLLCFHKRGADRSGKCDLTLSPGSRSWGALYQLDTAAQTLLDQFEGGYQRCSVTVQTRSNQIQAFTYLALPELTDPQLLPFTWYLQLVIQGGYHLGFEPDYLQQLQSHDVQPDADQRRTAEHQQLLARMQKKTVPNSLSTACVATWLIED